jgi:predicted 3-demethylubiquinone-9 3-methyltransferase (glyoxalase superfamily)
MATKEQLIKAINDRQSQIGQLSTEIKTLKEQLIELSEFKVGDKVRIGKKNGFKNSIEYTECFISEVYIGYKNKIDYKFSKMKKDGTMSGQSAGIYSFDSIELMISDKNPERSVASKAQ